MTDLSKFQHPRFARMYERISRESEARGTAEHRARMLESLTGRVIEIGAGNGMNFGHYPQSVTDVMAVEPEGRLRASAQSRRGGRLHAGDGRGRTRRRTSCR
jgi:protein-L-isoaspartate O-methyltransferase